MNQEFYKRFAHYTNVELLKIIKQPDDYQPEAVKTATEILTSRQVSDSDHMEADQFYKDKEENRVKSEEQISKAKGAVMDILEPFIKPGTEVRAARWIRIFLVMLLIQYVWMLVDTVKMILKSITDHYLDPNSILYILGLFYVPFLFFLIYKRRRWAWFILLTENLLNICITIIEFITYFFVDSIFYVDREGQLWTIAISTVFAFFLWRPEISEHFNLDIGERNLFGKRILWISLGIAGIYFLMGPLQIFT